MCKLYDQMCKHLCANVQILCANGIRMDYIANYTELGLLVLGMCTH